jgi:hypothetical protein
VEAFMDEIVNSLALAYSESPLLFWVLGSVLVYTLGTNALWLARSRGLSSSPGRGWLVQTARYLFYLGIPYLALGGWPRPPFSGLLSLEDLGLVGLGGRWPVTRWLEAVGVGLGFGLAALLFLLLAWANANRHAGSLRFPSRPWWAILVDVLYLEVHWAFYRGALAIVLGDLYVAVFLGLGLVYLEWGLNPFWRQGWRSMSGAAAQWLRAALALAVALLFLFTRNLWICLGVHTLLELAFWHLGRERATIQTVDVNR